MQKILLAIDALNPHKNTMDFAIYMARLTRSKITAIFLENVLAEASIDIRDVFDYSRLGKDVADNTSEYLEKKEAIEKNIQYCRDFFANHSVICSIHRDRGVPAHEVVEESRFADLL